MVRMPECVWGTQRKVQQELMHLGPKDIVLIERGDGSTGAMQGKSYFASVFNVSARHVKSPARHLRQACMQEISDRLHDISGRHATCTQCVHSKNFLPCTDQIDIAAQMALIAWSACLKGELKNTWKQTFQCFVWSSAHYVVGKCILHLT